MMAFIERMDIYERENISSRYKARIQECNTCGDIPDEGAIINGVLYCDTCAKDYVIDHYSIDELRNYFDTIFDDDNTDNEILYYIRTLLLSDLCDMFAGFGFEHWEY